MVNGKNFNNDNSGEIVLLPPSFTRIRHQIHLNVFIKNFTKPTITAISWLPPWISFFFSH